MKNQWPMLVFIVAVIGVVIFAFNYESNKSKTELGSLLSEGGQQPASDVEFEFVKDMPSANDQQVKTEAIQPAAVPAQGQTVAVAPSVQEISKAAPARVPEVKKSAPAATVASSSESNDLSGAKFTIQIGSYRDKEKAMQALKIQEKENTAFLVSKDLKEKGIWHRIYIGHFATKAQADSYLAQIKPNYKDSFVVSPR